MMFTWFVLYYKRMHGLSSTICHCISGYVLLAAFGSSVCVCVCGVDLPNAKMDAVWSIWVFFCISEPKGCRLKLLLHSML